jgi:flagellar FliL protein
MSQAEAAALAQATPKKSRKLLLIVVGLLILLAAGGTGAWFMLKPGHDTHAGKKEAAPRAPIFMPLETFTVNLMGEQYLQIDITLQLYDQAQVDLLKLHMPRIRSRLLTLLSSQDADALRTEADKQRLVQGILAAVRAPVNPQGKPQEVADVLFTSFVIQ